MFILIFTNLNILLCVGENLLEFFLVIRLAIGIVIGIELFIVEAANGCAARDPSAVEADDVVAVVDCGVEDVIGGGE